MIFDLVFSWAQHVDGGMVYVDDVPNGLACNCICPHCKERLLARHGTERAHHFAHFSKGHRLAINYPFTVNTLNVVVLSIKMVGFFTNSVCIVTMKIEFSHCSLA